MSGQMSVSGVLESALYVLDLQAAEEFYTDVLGLTFYSKLEGRHVFLRCGDRMVLLFNAEATAVSAGGPKDAPTHGAKGEGHLAFAVMDREIDQWKQHLVEKGVEIEQEIQTGGGRSIYFRDPSQNSLEVASPRIWGIPEETISSSA
ncbi:MAG: VOC family protein [Caldilineaceae bacterium]|nr:VOC family protein [Caldilineaceae bacterium]MDE0337400.1 VOC family protein [Caldilineaceae bacterium]